MGRHSVSPRTSLRAILSAILFSSPITVKQFIEKSHNEEIEVEIRMNCHEYFCEHVFLKMPGFQISPSRCEQTWGQRTPKCSDQAVVNIL